jgi:hypothetical protein
VGRGVGNSLNAPAKQKPRTTKRGGAVRGDGGAGRNGAGRGVAWRGREGSRVCARAARACMPTTMHGHDTILAALYTSLLLGFS